MCHCIRDKLTEYWTTTNQFPTRFYSSAMQRNRYRHILHFPHFTDNNNKPDMTNENSDGLWKTWNLCEILNKTFSQFHCPPEHLAVGEVVIFFSKEGPFSEIHSQKHKRLGIKIYKPSDETGYTYYMTVYSFLDGSEGISYSDSRFIFVDAATMEHVGRHEQHSTEVVCLGTWRWRGPKFRVNCEWEREMYRLKCGESMMCV
jgi:hypothetical protein